jgi:uncharacterized phage protein (TIGR02216 family)
MAFGLGVLRLSSREFWALTPRELEAAARGAAGRSGAASAPAPSLEDLAELMAAFPDHDPADRG